MNEKFAELGNPRRIWAIAAVHGDVDRLATLHDHLAHRFQVRDRIVYLGNYLGVESRHNDALFDELLAFRAAILSKTGVEPSDLTYLRGPAEEAWQRLLRLQFAPAPSQALERALTSGVEAYLRLYGVSVNDTKSVARAGSMAITRWTNQMRTLQRQAPGHETLMCVMRRAAYTQVAAEPRKTLFVPAGFDSSRALEDQGEALWWTSAPFRVGGRAQNAYTRIVRGFDSVNSGSVLDEAAVTLDGGCGRGGPLMCGSFTSAGKLSEIIAVGGQGVLESAPYEREAANDYHGGVADQQPASNIYEHTLAAMQDHARYISAVTESGYYSSCFARHAERHFQDNGSRFWITHMQSPFQNIFLFSGHAPNRNGMA